MPEKRKPSEPEPGYPGSTADLMDAIAQGQPWNTTMPPGFPPPAELIVDPEAD
jgi:hypothetical protein